MYFQSPQPYGQQAKSYRSIGGALRAATSMTSLPNSTANDGRASAPPVDFVTVYKQVPLENGFTSQSSRVQFPKNTSVDEQGRLSRGPGFYRVTREYEEERSTGSTGPAQRRVTRVHKTTSLQDASSTDGGSVNVTLTLPVDVPIQSYTPACECDNAVRLNVDHHEDYHRKGFTNNRFRSSSAVPFSDYTSTSRNIIVSRPVDVVPSGRLSAQLTQTVDKVSCFTRKPDAENNPQPSRDANGIQKPVIFQQFERHRNYATLHHVTSSKTPTLQRRISDPNLLKIDNNNAPTNLAMYNVAKGVKAELEQDPKFRKKADTLNQNDSDKVNKITPPPVPPRVSPKQSPSLRQMENFFANVQQFRNVLDSKPVPPVPAPKPFNVEHVRSIFRTDESRQPAPSNTKDSWRENGSVPTKSTNTAVKIRSVHVEQVPSSKNSESSVQIIHTASRPVNLNVMPLLNVRTVNSNEPAKTVFNMQKSRLKILSDRCADVQKPSALSKTLNVSNDISVKMDASGDSPADITALERDYNMSTPERHPLNQPFPVEESIEDTKKQAVRAASPQGILLKNNRSSIDSGLKTSKRVVFQCDGDGSWNGLKDAANSEVPQSIVQYDSAVEEPLQNFLHLCAQIGGDVQTVGDKLSTAFAEQRNFVWAAAGRKELLSNELQTMLTPIVRAIEDITAFKDSKRNTTFFNHVSAISEGVQAVGWLTIKPTPAPFIKETLDAAMFFVNRVFKDHKDDKVHTDWGKAWIELLNSLQKYVREVHTTGLVWNSTPGTKPPTSSSGGHASSITAPAPPVSGAPPPPPPPVLPPDLFSKISTSKESDDKTQADRAALFAEINAGEEITRRLKKVTPDMQTHKNPALRAQHNEAVDRERPPTSSTTSTPSKKQDVQKEPKTWLENGKQWNVEYHKDNKNVLVEASDMKETVYIYKCENSVIQIKGKVNSITLDGCKKTSVVFDSLLSQIEIINCQSVQIQTFGAMPTLSIQKTDGCQVYLSKEAMNAEIITSKSSEMNVLVPAAEDGDFVEFPIPEQFKTVYNGQKLLTTVSDIV